MTLLTELDAFYLDHELGAFYTEHCRCGDLDGGVDGPVVWIVCDYGAPATPSVLPEVHASQEWRAQSLQASSTIICVRRERLERRRLTHAIFQAFERRHERRDRDSARPVTYRHRTRA